MNGRIAAFNAALLLAALIVIGVLRGPNDLFPCIGTAGLGLATGMATMTAILDGEKK